ncbi:MAG: response regulator [Deltaproteobacteria bacterium]|nr:response regulator [Deltaproteobacteria bacterium]
MSRILVIDDDPFIRDVLFQSLSRAGHEITLAEDGDHGLSRFLSRFDDAPFDLVITDLIMPKKEGVETIAELKKIAPDAKIIAISGGYRLPAENYLKIASTLGVNGTLIKPFEKAELLDEVQRVLAE